MAHPQFASNKLVYLSYSKPSADGKRNTTAVIRGTFQNVTLTAVQELIEANAWSATCGRVRMASCTWLREPSGGDDDDDRAAGAGGPSPPVQLTRGVQAGAGAAAGLSAYSSRVQFSHCTMRSPRRTSVTSIGRSLTLHPRHSSPFSSATAPRG